MKRLLAALAIVCLLATPAACSPGYGQPAYRPHQDPATAQELADPVALLLFYGSALDLAAIGQYQDGQSLLDELKETNIPGELGFIIDRFNALGQQLFTALANLESLLDEASSLLAENNIGDAEQKLDRAGQLVDDTRLILEEFGLAIDVSGDSLGALAELASSELEAAHERLSQIPGRLNQLVDRLEQLRQGLVRDTNQAEAVLIPTELSLSVTPASVFVGDDITVSGQLTAGLSGLGGRVVVVTTEEIIGIVGEKGLGRAAQEVVVVTTDPDGSFSTSLTIPYNYVTTMTLRALYTPSGSDNNIYTASSSPPVVISTRFYSSQIEVSVPEDIHPGLPVTISGQLSSTGDTIERTLRLFLDNRLIAEDTIRDDFTIQFTPSPELTSGRYSLTLEVTSQGRYLGTSKSLDINISMIPVQADIQTPQLIILPESINIRGRVYHSDGSLEDAELRLTFGDSVTTARTSSLGSFNATLEAPLDLFLFGPQQLTVTLEPVEPWYAPLELEIQIIIINPALIGLMLVAFLSAGLLTYRRRTKAPAGPKGATSPRAGFQQPSPARPRPRRHYELKGIRGRILLAYLQALAAVEKAAGTSLAPQTTLREFLGAATPFLAAALGAFNELTTLAEVAMYSSHQPDRDTAARAEGLANAIKEEL